MTRMLNSMHQIAAMEVGSDELKWAWAVRMQESLWLAHDSYWVAQAKEGWPDNGMGNGTYQHGKDAPHAMLKTYGLLRGTHGKLLAGKSEEGAGYRKAFLDLAKQKADELVLDNQETNTKVWKEFGQKFRKCRKYPGEVDHWFMPSATLKAMWFFQPDKIPMYDQFANTGLGKKPAQKGNDSPCDTYLKRCNSVLKGNIAAITSAKAVWGSNYPYDIRIVDKYLWLKGSVQPEKILSRFQKAAQELTEFGKANGGMP